MKSFNNRRLYIIWALVFLFFLALAGRLFDIQILQRDFYQALASDQHQFFESLIPKRGQVKDRYGHLLATNKKFPEIYAVPKDIDNPLFVVNKLAEILDLDKEKLLSRLTKKNDPYEPIADRISQEQLAKIEQVDWSGIKVRENWRRFYPDGHLFAPVLGFVNQDGEGQYGFEEFEQERLKGEKGFIRGQKNALGSLVKRANWSQGQDGKDFLLTLDYDLQFESFRLLKEVVDLYEAEEGSILIMDANNGELLSLVNYPSFNPNAFGQVENIGLFINPVIQEVFEPGSVFKSVTMAAGLEAEVVGPKTTYYDKGERHIGGHVIKNWSEKSYGEQNMEDVLIKSLNTGAIFVAERLGREKFLQYVQKFGFGLPTGIHLTGERAGNIESLEKDRLINLATASFGQGISVTPLQMLSAIGVIANGGKLMQPHIIKGNSKEVRQVISPATAFSLSQTMVKVVNQGAKNARLPGYQVAGKTGTAQIPQKGGYSDDFIHAFAGFAPAQNPRFVVLIKLDKPQGVRFSATSLSPTFRKLTRYLLNYFRIAPQ